MAYNDENAKRTVANTNDSPRRLFVKTARTVGIQQNATTPRRHDFFFSKKIFIMTPKISLMVAEQEKSYINQRSTLHGPRHEYHGPLFPCLATMIWY
jgi:hypothetical protein